VADDVTAGTAGTAGAVRADPPRLLSATLLMSSGTVVSRVLGFARVLLVGNLLGNNSRQGTIFAVATTVPTSLYMLLAGGALNVVLVPQLVRHLKEDADGGEAYTNRIVTAFLLFVAAAAVLLTAASPLVTAVYSDAQWRLNADLAAQYRSMVLLTTLCLPQIFFWGMFFVGGQILNARGSFGPMMWAPVVNNVVQVAVLGMYAVIWGFNTDTSGPFSNTQLLVLGVGSLLGVVAQAVTLWLFMKRVGFRYRPRFDLVGTGLGKTFSIAKWTLGLVVLGEIGSWLFTQVGSSAVIGGSGAGNLVYETAALIALLPHSLITISITTALFPSMSHRAASGDYLGLAGLLTRGIRLSVTVVFPLALLLIALGVPISTLFYSPEKGGVLVGWTLSILGANLLAYTFQFLILRACYSLEDTQTPFWATVVFEVVRISAVLLAFLGFGVAPDSVAPTLAGCYTLACVVQTAWAMRRLHRKVPAIAFADTVAFAGKVLLASIPGAAAAWGICQLQAAHWAGFGAQFLGLAVAGISALAIFLVAAKLLRIAEVWASVAAVLNKLRRAAL
jgi:putative peptidoglycan lipid II flippase